MSKEKQVIMTYAEHQRWLIDREKHREEMERIGKHLQEQEKIMQELIHERSDIVVIERHQINVDPNYVKPSSYRSLRLGYQSPDGRYVNFPRFIGTDAVAHELDKAFMELRASILEYQEKLKGCRAGRERDKVEFNAMNKAIPINVWNELGRRRQEKIRKMLHAATVRINNKS